MKESIFGQFNNLEVVFENNNNTFGIVSYLQKNVHTECVYSYFVHTG